MNNKNIHILIEKYFDGETSLSEENRLFKYFRGNDISPDLLPYKEMFVDMALISKPHKATGFTIPLRWASGIAASILVIVGSFILWQEHQYSLFCDQYADSYMIVNGNRIDDLKIIKGQIQTTIAEANALEKVAQDNAIADAAENDILNSISDSHERARLEQLLNE